MDASPVLTVTAEREEIRTHDPSAPTAPRGWVDQGSAGEPAFHDPPLSVGRTQNPALVVSDFDQPADLELPDNVDEDVIVTQTQDSHLHLEPEHQ
jgi:hypothetical protein